MYSTFFATSYLLNFTDAGFRGVEYQHRSRETFQPFADRRYPLSFDQRIQQGDDFRRSEEELSLALKSIEESFDGSPKEPHTGEPDCKTCIAQKERIWQAYRNFYLGDQPGRWDSNLPAYRQEITEMFSDPNKYTLETIQSRFHQELREHLKKDICFVRQDIDSASVEELKSGLRLVFQQDSVPTEVILRESLQAQLQVPGVVPRDAAEFLSALQNTTTSQERVQIYQKYYCTPAWGDTPQQKNMKAKYERLFESGMSHDNVLSQWKKEVLEIQNQKASQLKHRLGELQMAQSAHLKNKAKKAEKDQRMQDFVQSQTAGCSLPRCQKVVDLEAEEGALECVVCKWLANKAQTEGRRREHAYYCSEEHAEEDFVSAFLSMSLA